MKRLIRLLLVLTLVACDPGGNEKPTISPVPSFTLEPSPTVSPASEFEIFFGDASCSWPCWQGITPGITTSSDALQLLQASPVVLEPTIQSEEIKPGFGTARWSWQMGNNQFDGEMSWQYGIVSSIDLAPYPTLSIGEIVSRFGSPEKVSVFDCSSTPEGLQVWCANFYYIKRGFEIRLRWNNPEHMNDIQLSPSDPVRFVYLLGSSAMEDLLLYLGSGGDQVIIRDWKGYGNLLDLYVR